MHSLTVNGVHLLGAILGFFLICRLAGSTRFSGLMWPFTLAFGAMMATFIFLNTQPLMKFVFWDFTECYWLAGHLVWKGPQALAGAYSFDTLVFVNLPVVAYLFAPFGLMPPMVAAIVFSLIGVGAVALIWQMLVRMYGLDSRESAILVFALLVFGPLIYSFKVGNTSHFVLAMLLGGIALIRSGKGYAAGAFFGLAAVIKPALLIIGVLYFVRGRWSVVAGGASVLIGSVALSLLIFGWDMHVLWYESSVQPYAGNPVIAYANQTLQGMVARFEDGGPYDYNYSMHVLSDGARLAAQVLALIVVAAVAFAIWTSGRFFRPTNGDIELETLIVVMFTLIFPAAAWAHYHVWLLPVLVVLWARSRPGEPLAKMRIVLLGSFALVAGTVFLSHSMTLGRFGPVSNLVVSHMLWGTLVLLALLSLLRAQRARAETNPASNP